jgi:hypothetical protein
VTDTQFYLALGIPSLIALINTCVVLVGILLNNARLTDLRKDIDLRFDAMQKDMDTRFDAMEKLFTEKLLRVEQVMDARIKHLEDNE